MTVTKSQSKVLMAGAALLILNLIPFLNLVLLPLTYLYTYFHELAHALMALLTGGVPTNIQIFNDGSGVTWSAGGFRLLVTPAGYIGAAIMAAGLILCARKATWARRALVTMAVVLAIALGLYVRGDIVGLLAGIFWLAVLIVMAKKLTDDQAEMAVQFLGIAMATSSLRAVWELVGIVHAQAGENDAVIMQRMTGIPAILSAGLWVLITFTVVGFALRKTWKSS